MSSKHAVIVGANGSVGTAVEELLIAKAYDITTTSSRRNPASKKYLNLSDFESIESFADEIEMIDLLVIAAGKEPQQNLDGLSIDHLNDMIDIHYKGPLWLVKQLRSKMKKGACIVFLGSVAAQKGSYDPTYASLKAAISGLVKTLAREMAPDVTLGNVAPGLIEDSPVFNRMTDDFRARHLQNNITGSLLKPEEVAQTIYLFVEQRQLTGQTIHLNGGQYFAG
jgi:3-oxoacyl-[acyl-carrier protein] reductase